MWLKGIGPSSNSVDDRFDDRSKVDDCFVLSPLSPELWCPATTVMSSDIVGGYFSNTHMTWKSFWKIMFVLHRHLWIAECSAFFMWHAWIICAWGLKLIRWKTAEAGDIKFIVCRVECVCRSMCINAEGSRKTSQSYLDQTSSAVDVVNPGEVVVYDAAKRLRGPDLINAVVTLQQPLWCVCVRENYCRISVSAFVEMFG